MDHNDSLPPEEQVSAACQSPLRPSEFIDYLDQEIKCLRSQMEQPGWTPWALLAALAALAWAALNVISSAVVRLPSVLSVLVLLALLEDTLEGLAFLLTMDLQPYPRRPFVLSNRRLGENRLRFLGVAVRSTLILIIASRSDISDLGCVFTSLTYWLYLIMSLIVLVYSFLRIPFPTRTSRFPAIRPILFIWMFSLPAIAVVCVARYLPQTQPPPSVTEVQVAAISFAIIYVLSALAKTSGSGVRTASALADLRRDVAFGITDVSSATKHASMLLVGHSVSDIVERDVHDILKSLRQVQASIATISERYKALASQLPSDARDLSPDHVSLLTTVLEWSAKMYCPLQRHLREVRKRFTSLQKRLLYLISLASDSSDSDPGLVFLMDSLDQAIIEVGEQLDGCIQVHDALQALPRSAGQEQDA